MRKTKQELENEIIELERSVSILKEQSKQPSTSICNNLMTGVNWDAKALTSVEIVAKGLFNLTELFKSQNIHIDCMIKVETPKP